MTKMKQSMIQAISLVVAVGVLWTNFFGAQTHLYIASGIIAVNAVMEFMK